MNDTSEKREPLKAVRLASRTIFRGEKLTLRVDTLQMGDREATDKEIIAHPGSAVMIPITERGTVLLVKQWRAGARGVTRWSSRRGRVTATRHPETDCGEGT